MGLNTHDNNNNNLINVCWCMMISHVEVMQVQEVCDGAQRT